MATRGDDYKRGYMKGYWSRHSAPSWPEYTPPNPPQEQVAVLFQAAKNLRDAAFGLLQVIDADDGPDGPFVTLQKEARAVDAAFVKITAWLKTIP